MRLSDMIENRIRSCIKKGQYQRAYDHAVKLSFVRRQTPSYILYRVTDKDPSQVMKFVIKDFYIPGFTERRAL